MASLSSSSRLGNTSTSSLIRSASSLQSQINSYNDSLAAYEYELSPKTSADFDRYQAYLTGRITNLQATGSVTDAQKALTLTRTLTSAVHSNVSADIQRENIDIMSGNASLPDKYNTIVSQYQRAIGIGDLSLAQQLESQAYSVSQSIQYQAQQAQQAATTLRNAAISAKVSDESAIAGSLDDSLKQLNNDIKTLGIKDANKVSGKWVDANRQALQDLGVVIPQGAQPNYWDLVHGIQSAKYNALVLKAQAQSVTSPAAAQNTLRDALLISQGGTTIDTLGGRLTIQQIQQAAQDPSMFAYDNATGKYKPTAQVGYQYVDGNLAPKYSGIVGDKTRNQIYFLNPTQTAELTGLGLNFSAHQHKGTGADDPSGLITGDGVQVQLTANTPGWLKNILGQNGTTKAFTDNAGNLQFAGPSTTGQGMSYFTLVNVGGLSGVFEHSADGSSRLVGGNYGFDAGAAQLLVNMGQQKQYQIQLQTKAEQAAQAAQLKLAAPPALPQISIAPPAPTVNPQTYNPQRTVTTSSLQGGSTSTASLLQPAAQIQSNVQGVPLTQPKLNGIKL